ncbi:hypothetical protein KOW79_001928 [Hemibagrus wyckioides]|uniref:Uncharacterized protein n=1 Tax=Hemibagrus wyckioides TaxID=337641 RepID=A0A9D3SSS1_9TELE|nr:hypothetical protein KOW79_001928 [Hemibagrus wyckioides]
MDEETECGALINIAGGDSSAEEHSVFRFHTNVKVMLKTMEKANGFMRKMEEEMYRRSDWAEFEPSGCYSAFGKTAGATVLPAAR